MTADTKSVLLDAWKKSEDVAMHFNELLLGLRAKAVAGVTAAAGLVLNSSSEATVQGSSLLGLAMLLFLIYLIDRCYYYRLLKGAVLELLRLEEELRCVSLSKQIERAVQGRDTSPAQPFSTPSWCIHAFYMVPVSLLAMTSLYLLLQIQWTVTTDSACRASALTRIDPGSAHEK